MNNHSACSATLFLLFSLFLSLSYFLCSFDCCDSFLKYTEFGRIGAFRIIFDDVEMHKNTYSFIEAKETKNELYACTNFCYSLNINGFFSITYCFILVAVLNISHHHQHHYYYHQHRRIRTRNCSICGKMWIGFLKAVRASFHESNDLKIASR